MSTERDKFLTEALGECWHEKDITSPIKSHGLCTCGVDSVSHYELIDHLDEINNNFSTWEGFGLLWTWSQKQEWWIMDFMPKTGDKYNLMSLVDPDRFANAVYEVNK